MYAMNVATSSIFHIIMFPHNGKIITIGKITYHPPSASNSPISAISAINNALFPPNTIGLRIFKDVLMLDVYHEYSPIPSPESLCVFLWR
jgi:hypothetical protein